MKVSGLNITVVGAGYVGLSIATLLSTENRVVITDISKDKVDKINKRTSPICDEYIERYFTGEFGVLDITATTNSKNAYKNADFIIIAVPTNYDPDKNRFDTHCIEDVVEDILDTNRSAVMVIKSTIPVGYTESLYTKYGDDINLLFSPEFLREGTALYDNLYPSRIIVGVPKNKKELNDTAETFSKVLQACSLKETVAKIIMGASEAESVKLFANTYLAMRVSYFNELDTYAEMKNLNTHAIIEGVCMDPRIGYGYNNPSFGYGGYCLPKDTKQLLSSYTDNCPEVHQELISAIVKSNTARKLNITYNILEKISELSCPIIGVYRLTMKSGSDNFRESAVLDIMEYLKKLNPIVKIIIFEPAYTESEKFNGFDIIKDFDEFKNISDLIVANRYDTALDDVKQKVYTRDIFHKN